FLYLIYYYAMVNVYQTVPVLYNDLQFAKVGWSIATQRFPILFALGIAVLAGIIFAFFYLGQRLAIQLAAIELFSFSGVLLCLLGVYNVYRGMRQKYVIIHKKLMVAPLIHFIKNIKVSIESRAKMKAWKPEFFNSLNIYQDSQLKQRPNIIIASLESYGAIINELPELRDFFGPKLVEEGKLLEEAGWYSSTILSKAPRISGGSWLSHSSFLYGIFINEFAIYESLMNNPVFEKYQSLLHVLKDKGYANYYVNPLGGYDMSRINWDQIQRMFAADEIINDEAINYQGKRTGSMGDSSPDQYGFRFAFDRIQKAGTDPWSMFFISNNSHYSWLSPKNVEENWRNLNKGSHSYEQTEAGSTALLQKYKDSINYQLDIFLQFLQQEDPENTVLVLFGDHQPPAITTKDSTFHSPIHIIARDKEFVKGFKKYGFREGLLHDDPFAGIAHQSFFSLFMKELIETYGVRGKEDLAYLPNGHQILG
ncbi:MAG: sulfatase-like hydrolase/transferase, partial [Bacteroidota bacterium]